MQKTDSCKKSPQAWGLKVASGGSSKIFVLACKKSPQAWGLKELYVNVYRTGDVACKKSPQAWGLKVPASRGATVTPLLLAKRVPKHGD